MSDLMALLGKLAMVQRLYSRHMIECRLCGLNMYVTCVKKLELRSAGEAIEAELTEEVAA